MLEIRSRLKAFSIHLCVSAAILVILSVVIFFYWFPGSLFKLSGGMDGLQIVIMVDLVLGPLLTFVAYNTGKPRRELFRDLLIIASLQAAGLIVGICLVYQSRPVLISYVYDTFFSYKMADIVDDGIDRELLGQFSGTYPKIVVVEVPQDPADFLSLQMMTTLQDKKPLSMRTDLYRPFPESKKERMAIMHGLEKNEELNCWITRIKSVYRQGDVCIDIDSLTFSHFKERIITGNSLVGDNRG